MWKDEIVEAVRSARDAYAPQFDYDLKREQRRPARARYHSRRKRFLPPMAAKSGPDLGINSWLEDELYQQYLHDRSTVDETWKHVFEANGNGANGVRVAAASSAPAAIPSRAIHRALRRRATSASARRRGTHR